MNKGKEKRISLLVNDKQVLKPVFFNIKAYK